MGGGGPRNARPGSGHDTTPKLKITQIEPGSTWFTFKVKAKV